MPEAKIKGRDIAFSERTCFHKIARIVYKIFRLFYIAVLFYWIPFFTMVSWAIAPR
jgi:hypothetical protein